ncbi:MAG: hypothetical protein ACE5IL_00550 [Myxococcota bacterium]
MRSLKLVALLAACLGAGGYWNYQRNAYLDRDLEFRPFASYSVEQIELLLQARRGEAARLQRSSASVPDGVALLSREDPSDLGGKARAFDRFQHAHSRWRAQHGEALEEQARIEGLEKELEIRRAGLDREWQRILRRALRL